ncbi:MAG: glycoside hydrolase family 16 protein, partial [Staphylothermus sp.]|nr:glycoside hydrolase family 16 protein [Staphylothermus sp.]
MSHKNRFSSFLVLTIFVLAIMISQLTTTLSAYNGALANSSGNESLSLIKFMDFNESTIDESIWNFNIGNGCPNLCGWGNNELEYYTRDNAFIENGNLVIEARKEQYVDPATGNIYQYTSARLDTIGKLKITPPARIEVRAKLPKGKGLWPAIWLIGEEWSLNNTKAWPSCGEIDIMELVGHEPDTVHG